MKRRRFLSGLAAALASSSRRVRADAVDDALRDVTKARAGLQTLVGGFTQERTIGLLATVVRSEGEMTLVRPDRLRWELKPPDAITYWIGPEGLAYATPSGGAAVGKGAAGRFGAVLGDLMTLLGGDLAGLRARYDLSVQRVEGAEGGRAAPREGAEGGRAAPREAGLVLGARPRAEDVKKHVSSLTLRLPANLWAVQRIEIEEVGGDRSVISFPQIARDVRVDPARMTPPRR